MREGRQLSSIPSRSPRAKEDFTEDLDGRTGWLPGSWKSQVVKYTEYYTFILASSSPLLGMINLFSLTPKMLLSGLHCHCDLDLYMISHFLIHSHSRNEFSSSQTTISSRTSVAHPSGEHGLVHQQCNTSEVCHQGWQTGHKAGCDSWLEQQE